jgi:hypothetical protein
MAVTQSSLTVGTGASATSFTTASVVTVANQLTLVAVGAGFGTAIPTVSGAGGNWVLVNSDSSGGGGMKTALFRDLSATPGTGALTIDFGTFSQNFCIWSVDSFGGVDTSGVSGAGAVVQTASNFFNSGTNSGITVTLGAFSSVDNATYGVVQYSEIDTVNVGAGFTQIFGTTSSSRTYNNEWKTSNDTTVDWTWVSAVGKTASALAIEIKAGVAPAARSFRSLLGVGI